MCHVCVLLFAACVSVRFWSVLQFALQDLKIALANTLSVHPLFVLYCIVYYKSVCACGVKHTFKEHQPHTGMASSCKNSRAGLF